MNNIEAAKRLLSVPVKKKEPVIPEIMLSLFQRFGGSDATLSDLRLLTLFALGYAGFLRFSELATLRRLDFVFDTSYMRVFIERSKTDIYRNGAWVLVAETATPTCPVALCKRFFALAHIRPCSQEYIFDHFLFCLAKTRTNCGVPLLCLIQERRKKFSVRLNLLA